MFTVHCCLHAAFGVDMVVTFVCYLSLSWGGAFLTTLGIFTPAFTFSLFGYHPRNIYFIVH